eukprot:gene296-1630_t
MRPSNWLPTIGQLHQTTGYHRTGYRPLDSCTEQHATIELATDHWTVAPNNMRPSNWLPTIGQLHRTTGYHRTGYHGTPVHRDLDKSEGEFHLLPQESGRYRFCLTVSTVKHNPMHGRGLMKEVVWDLHTSYYHVENHEKDSLKDNDAEDLWHYVHNVESMIQQVRSTQQYLYWKERRHRQTVDSTNSRVWWAAITRCLGLITVSVSQIIFIRRLFMR